MIQVVPAIIPRNKEQIEEEIKLFASFTNLIQIDICDGVFTRSKSWPYNGVDVDYFDGLKHEELGLPKWEDVDFEFHLMVQNPEEVLEDYIEIGASSIVVQIESTKDFQKIIDTCRKYNVGVGIAIKPSTDISTIEPYVSQVDFIQCMGSDQLGRHNSELEEKSIEQIKKLRSVYPESIIGIDIGVNLDTKETLIEAGANKLISGGAILDADKPREAYDELSS